MLPRLLYAFLSVLAVALTVKVSAAPAFAQGSPVSKPADGLSYTLPAGWQALDLKNALKTLRALASPAGNAAATLTVQDISSALSPEPYVRRLLAGLKASAPQTYVLSRGPFTTRSGLHGYRAVFDETAPGGSVHFVVCVFPAPGRRRLLVAALWPLSDTTKYEAPVDQALKTFTLKGEKKGRRKEGQG